MSDLMPSEMTWTADRDAFQHQAELYRYQLQVHCYRMLGSFHEAEDLVQETFLRAWRARERYQGRTSFRNWLYRIATNACLNALATRSSAHRVLPDSLGPPWHGKLEGEPAREIAWLEPYPDSALYDVADAAPGPDAHYELQESVQLAFIAAIQQLPARQRAVLLLRDVLGWSAAETAQFLDTSIVSVNSALQRARATLERQPEVGMGVSHTTDAAETELLERYMQSWQAADVEGFVALLKEDAVLRMPPWRQWFLGRDAIRAFFTWAWESRPRDGARITSTRANAQPAFAHYILDPDHGEYRAHNVHVLTIDRNAIAIMSAFLDPRLFAAFGLPRALPR